MKSRNVRSTFVIGLSVAVTLYASIHDSPQSRSADELRSVEDLVRCSDLVVLATVTETYDGIRPPQGGMVQTSHLLKVQSYFVGTGPQEITVLTPGGFERDPNGRETWTQIVGSEIGLRPGDSFLGFLQVFPPAYRLLNKRGSKAVVVADDSTGDQTVRLRFGNVDLLGARARERYEELKAEVSSLSGTEREIVVTQLEYALTEAVPVSELSSRIEKVLTLVGGPKPPNMICY